MNTSGKINAISIIVMLLLIIVAIGIYAFKPIQERSFDKTIDIELNSSVDAVGRMGNYDYWVVVQIIKPGPDAFVFDKINAKFRLDTLVLELNKTPSDGDEWIFEPDDHFLFLFKTEGKTAEFINMAKNSSQKNIKFTVSLENDGKMLDSASSAIIPNLDKLIKDGSSPLDLSPRFLTVKSVSTNQSAHS